MQINLTGFLNGSKAREFMGELWQLLYSAQTSKSGIPAELVLAKAQDIMQRVCPPVTFDSSSCLLMSSPCDCGHRRQRKRSRK